MRICVVTEYFDNTGGTPTILSNLFKYLGQHYPDLTIDVVTSKNLYRGAEKLPKHEMLNGINVFRLQTPKSNRSSTILRVAAGLSFTIAVFFRLLFSRRHDLLFCVTSPPTLPLAVKGVSQIKKIPYLYLIHDLYPDVAVVLNVLAKESKITRCCYHFQRSWLHGSYKSIVLGRCMQRHLKENYQLPQEKIEVITNWCDPQSILSTPYSHFRDAHNLKGTVILYAGNFGLYQSFDEILDAAKILRSSNPQITIVLVGEGAQENFIKKRVAQEKISNVKIFPLVSQQEYPDVLAAADISLITLVRGAEGVGVPSKFHNILASGRPTIAVVSPDSEVGLVLKEAKCGVQVNQGDAVRLAETIKDMASSPSDLKRMGANARKVLEEKYTIDLIAERFYQVICECFQERKRS